MISPFGGSTPTFMSKIYNLWSQTQKYTIWDLKRVISLLVSETEVGGDDKRKVASRSQICVLSPVSQNAPKCLKVSLERESSREVRSLRFVDLLCQTLFQPPLESHLPQFTSLPCYASGTLWNCNTSSFLTDWYISAVGTHQRAKAASISVSQVKTSLNVQFTNFARLPRKFDNFTISMYGQVLFGSKCWDDP